MTYLPSKARQVYIYMGQQGHSFITELRPLQKGRSFAVKKEQDMCSDNKKTKLARFDTYSNNKQRNI